MELSDHQARKLGAILGEAFFKPAVVEEAVTAPEPSEILRAGDRLVVVSRPQDLGPFRDLVVG